MDLKGIITSKVSQRKTNTVRLNLNMESKAKTKILIEKEIKFQIYGYQMQRIGLGEFNEIIKRCKLSVPR